jgi:hypothetical protein
MRKTCLLLLTLLFPVAHEQAQNIEHQIVASQFGEYRVPSVGNGFAFPPDTCQVSGGGKNFAAFTAGMAIKIVDSQPSHTEVVTPVAVFINSCAVSLSTTYTHTSFYLTSGTGGLQEAILNGQVNGGPNTIVLDSEWYSLVQPRSAATVISTVQGNTSLGLVDVTQTPYVTYSWNGSQYAANSNTGGPPSGAAGGALSGTYPNPGIAVAALPNGMTATTQSAADNSNDVATDSFVQANKVTGGIVGAPAGSQAIAQPAGTTLHLNNVLASPINNVVYADGVNGAGIGVAQTAWSSATAYPQCTAVSFSGGNYLGVAASSNVTPSTNQATWYPVPNAATPTQLDCAFYLAASQVGGGAGSALRLGPGTYLSNIGLVEPTVTVPGWPIVNIYGHGRAVTTIKLNTNNGDGFPFLYLPKTSVNYAFASFNWEGFTVDANYNSTGAVGIYGAQQYMLKDLIVADAADGSDHEIEFGDSTDTLHGWTFEPDLENIDLGTFKGFGTGAIIASTVASGVPSFTVTAGGSGYTSADTKAVLAGTSDFGRPCSSMGTTTATIVSGVITGISSTATGCVAPLYTIVYSGPNINYGYKFSNTSDSKFISGMTNGGVGWIAGMYLSNITSQMEIYKYHPESVMTGVQNYGGAALYSLQCDTVFQYCLDVEGAGVTDVIAPVFEWNNPNMTASRDYYFGLVSGTPGFSGPQAVNIYGERCGNQAQQPGYAHFDSAAGVIDGSVGSDAASMPVYVHATHPLYCNELGQSATVQSETPTMVGANIGLSNGVFGNQWNFNLGTNFLNGGTQTLTLTQPNTTNVGFLGQYTWMFSNPTAATSGNNYGSPNLGLSGTYWSGSASAAFGVNQQLSFAGGSNPQATYSFSQTGTEPSGGLQFTFPGSTLVLPSGSTATTQTSGDNTGDVATDAFVHSAVSSLAATNTTNTFTAAQTAPGFLPQTKSAGPYTVLFDDYYSGANNASNNIGTPTGASCSVNTTYTDINHPGNILLTAGTGGTGTGITCGYQSESASVVSPNSSSLGWTWETAVYVPVLPGTTAGSFQGGLTSGPNANPWTTGIQFYLSSANSVANDWYCRYNSTSTDSTVAAVAATWTRLTMVNDGTFVHWYINGTEAIGCKTAVASMPSGTQYPASWSATALSATSVTMAVDYVDFQRATAR